jgi:hypothetical protein
MQYTHHDSLSSPAFCYICSAIVGGGHSLLVGVDVLDKLLAIGCVLKHQGAQ